MISSSVHNLQSTQVILTDLPSFMELIKAKAQCSRHRENGRRVPDDRRLTVSVEM